ncbi:MAG: MarR family winged helix-turn-helix transcriptional regulator [Ktedonobacterales bacterium]
MSRALQANPMIGGDDGPEAGERQPTAAELAEAFILTAHTMRHSGKDCADDADPALRAVSVPRVRVLMALASDDDRHVPVRMGDLSRTLGVTARNITTIVDGLEREGFLARRPDLTDRRAILIELTEFGRAHVQRLHQLHCEMCERFFAALSADDRNMLMRLLSKIRLGTAGHGSTRHGLPAHAATAGPKP